MKSLRQFALRAVPACAIAASAMAPLAASAGTIQLGFILDGSGSIGSTNWTTIVNGLSSAVNTLIPVGGPDTYEISVVSFGATATININSFVVDTVANRSALASTIAGIAYLNGASTNYSDALTKMQTAMTDTVGTAGFVDAAHAAASYVNFATDGAPNSGGTNGTGEFATARTSLITAGIDNISVEGIGSAVNATLLQTQLCYPLACDATSPYDFPNKGFYIPVATAAQYAAAIDNKIRIVTHQLPEPGTLALVGMALAGLGLRGRKALKA
jgi:hypothetical protein